MSALLLTMLKFLFVSFVIVGSLYFVLGIRGLFTGRLTIGNCIVGAEIFRKKSRVLFYSVFGFYMSMGTFISALAVFMKSFVF